MFYIFFFFNDTATTEIYTLSLHDALPISRAGINRTKSGSGGRQYRQAFSAAAGRGADRNSGRSEEHTSELQSHSDLVCRLLLEKKKKNKDSTIRASPYRKRTYIIGILYSE